MFAAEANAHVQLKYISIYGGKQKHSEFCIESNKEFNSVYSKG